MRNQMKYCIYCGAQIPEADLFCNQCGARQPDEQDYQAASLFPKQQDLPAPEMQKPAAFPRQTVVQKTMAPAGSVREHMFRVADTSARQKNIRALIAADPEYRRSDAELANRYGDGAKIYKNQFQIEQSGFILHSDQKIEIQCNGMTVGTAPAKDAELIRTLLREKRLEAMRVEIYGGPYKKIHVDYTLGEYEVEKRDGSAYIVMAYLTYRQ